MLTPYYDHAGITLYCADCREVLPTLAAGSVDLVLTDPPYGLKEARYNGTHGDRSNCAKAGNYGTSAWDDAPPDTEILQAVIAAGRNAIVWGGNYFVLPPSSKWLVWDKDNGTNDFADCELAWTNLPGAVRKLRFRWNGMLQEYGGRLRETRFHPTQKPLFVMRWCLGQAGDAALTVADFFAGSGTTLLAAKLEGRRAIGCEIDERYCQIAAKRLEQEVLPFAEPAQEEAVQLALAV